MFLRVELAVRDPKWKVTAGILGLIRHDFDNAHIIWVFVTLQSSVYIM